jgi:hypothetical protein
MNLRLPCGWLMGPDNTNFRSVNNFPIQGCGSSILRKAVANAQDLGLNVSFTLHDALYIEFKSDRLESMSKLRTAMLEAFYHYFEGKQKVWSKAIRVDGNVWGPDFEDGELSHDNFTFKSQNIYIDERGIEDYKQFSRYF